jgi:hypothetical protein
VPDQPVAVELFYAGDWNDHTGEVFTRDPIALTRGRAPGADLAPGSASLSLDNRAGRWNPRNPASDLFGLIGRNTPVRISMRPGHTSGDTSDASDDFSTPVADSWGIPDVGPAWHEYGAGGTVLTSDFDVAGGFGTHYVPTSNAYRACRLDLQIVDCVQAVTFKCAQATGASLEPANLMFRGQPDASAVLARTEVTTGNAVVCRIYAADGTLLDSATVPSLTHAGTGTPLRVKARTVGRDVFMRVWNPAGVEPAVWHLQATDTTAGPVPGFVGVRSGRTSGNTNGTDPQFSYDDYAVSVDDPLFVGEVSSWTPRTSPGGDAWTYLQAGGVLRRLSQGDDPLDSAARRAYIAAGDEISSGPVAYWPGEDDEHALEAASLVAGVAPLRPVGTSQFQAPVTGGALPPAGLPKFAAGPGPVGSNPLMSLTEGGRLDGQIPAHTTDSWELHWTMTHETGAASASAGSEPLLFISEGSAARWLVDVTDTAVTVFVSDADDNTIDSFDVALNHYDGAPHEYSIIAEQDGGNVIGSLFVDGESLFGNAVVMAGETVGALRSVTVNPLEERGEHQATGLGHIALFTPFLTPAEGTFITNAVHGHPGETAGRRLERLCAEEGIAFSWSGDLDATVPLAAQRTQTLRAHLMEAERTDGGLLLEPAGFAGLHYRTREDLYHQAASLPLDFAAGDVAPPLEPVVDELDVFNDVTAKRPDGATARAIQTAGPMNVNNPAVDADGIGRYNTAIDVNPEDPSQLQDLAAWYLAQGTADEVRYPSITVDLDATPGLAAAVSATGPGDVLTVANLELETVTVMVSEVAQTIGPFRRVVTFAGAPAVPYGQIGVFDDAGSKFDSAYSTLSADFDAGVDTSLSVAVEAGRTLWVTGSGAPQFPFNVRAAGVVLEVTAISGASSPQTFTVTAAPVNGVPARTIPAGTQLRLAGPVRYGL